MLRRLRIAVSVFFAVVTVALCVLWIRSYRYRDEVNYRYWPTRVVEIVSLQSRVEFANGDSITDWPNRLNSHTISEWKAFRLTHQWGFSGNTVGSPLQVSTPHYVVILATAGLTVAPWLTRIPRRFTLRTLFIATTLLAVILGLIAVLVRYHP